MKLRLPLSLLFLLSFIGISAAPPYTKIGFIENKGQIVDQNNNTNHAVKYLLHTLGNNISLKKNGFSYDTYNYLWVEENKASLNSSGRSSNLKTQYNFHRVDVEFLDANPEPEIISFGKEHDYLNYYTTSDGALITTFSYQKVIYKNVYKNIDIEFISYPGNNKTFEYNFILYPGSKISDIKLSYSGMKSFNFSGKALQLNLRFGSINEMIPKSYVFENAKEVKVIYKLLKKENENIIVGFKGTIDPHKTTIIDPTPNLDWGTYCGGSGNEDYVYGTGTDSYGSVIVTGQTSSANNISTVGAHQVTFSGGTWDAFICKYDLYGVRQWGTYYGGTSPDWGTGICIDVNDNIYVIGITSSSGNISTLGAQQTSYGGGVEDAFVLKLNPGGTRLWGTYCGGSGWDEGLCICLDPSGNVFVGGYTASTNGIVTAGAYQTTFGGGGNNDGFIVKYNSLGVRQWGTYYGATGDEKIYGIASDKNGNIDIIGWTGSTVNIATPGAYQTTYAGAADSFIAQFNNSGVRQWATYYGGAGADAGLGICTDPNNNLYVTGNTSSTSNISTSGSHQTTFGGATFDGFIVKFNSVGIRKWATYYGGSGNDGGNAVTIDAANYLIVVGVTSSNSNISTPGAYKTNFGGSNDAFVARLDTNGVRNWGTYYGINSDDRAYSVSSDASSNLFVGGRTNAPFSIATTGAQQSTYGGGLADGFLLKFSSCNTPATPINISQFSVQNICTNSSTSLTAIGSGTLNWYAGSSSTVSLATGTTFVTPSLTTGATPSTYSFFVEASTCSLVSTSRCLITITVNPLPIVLATTSNTLICAGQTATLASSGANSYNWNPGGSGAAIVISPTISTTYTVTGTDINGCTNSDTITQLVSACTAIIESFSQNSSIKIYPTPFNSSLFVEVSQPVTLDIYNILGEIIQTELLSEKKSVIDLRGKPNGLYFIKVGNTIKKIIKE